MLLSFSIGTFLTNYDITYRNLQCILTYSIVQKWTKQERNNPIETTSWLFAKVEIPFFSVLRQDALHEHHQCVGHRHPRFCHVGKVQSSGISENAGRTFYQSRFNIRLTRHSLRDTLRVSTSYAFGFSSLHDTHGCFVHHWCFGKKFYYWWFILLLSRAQWFCDLICKYVRIFV